MRFRQFVSFKTTALLLFALVMLIDFSWSDGGFFIIRVEIPAMAGYSADQRAIIIFDQKRKTETLVLSTKYHGTWLDFAWVIPVPQLPNREQIDLLSNGNDAFREIAKFTEPRAEVEIIAPSCGGCGGYGSSPTEPTLLEVIDRFKVKGMDIALLQAQDANELTEWLNANGYRVPQNASETLAHYITRQWKFVAIKVDANDEETTQRMEVSSYFPYEPLVLTFHTDECVLPMKISSLSSKSEESNILVFVFSNHRMSAVSYPTVEVSPPKITSFSEFRPAYEQAFRSAMETEQGRAFVVEYAGLVNPDQFSRPLRNFLIRNSSADYLFLTRLRTLFRPSDMKDDIFLKADKSDKPVSIIVRPSGSQQSRAIRFLIPIALSICWFFFRRSQKRAWKEAFLVGLISSLVI